MKKILVAVLVVAVTLVLATAAMATISGSKHDLSTTSGAATHATNGNLSSCQFCHTPHLGNNPVVTGAPLWNRSISAGYNAAGAGQYTVYGAALPGQAGSTLGQTGGVLAPGANSKTCLSCHDGTLSMGTVLVGSGAPTTWTDSANSTGGLIDAGAVLIGTDLKQEHPVGIIYNSSVTIAGLRIGADANNRVNGLWKLYAGGDMVGTVECGSCHDPHSNDNAQAGPPSDAPFLKGAKGTMCSDCHSRK